MIIYFPETIFHSLNRYQDMWGAGCVFAELLMRRPLVPGENYLNQLSRVLDLLGSPFEEDLENIQSERAKKFIRSQGQKTGVDLSQLFHNTGLSDDGVDLIKKLLVFNPVTNETPSTM